MDINNLTLGQIKEIQALFNLKSQSRERSGLFDRYVGQYVICRSRNEGVNAGVVVECDETGVILKDARRLYYHKPLNKNLSWYEGIALSGLSSDSKVGPAVEKLIIEDYSLTVCTQTAENLIRGAATNAQN